MNTYLCIVIEKSNDMTVGNVASYKGYYSDAKFWNVLSGFACMIGRRVIYQALCLYYVMKSPYVSAHDKCVIIGALGYLILPVDLIPDAVPVLGFTDDAEAIAVAYMKVRSSITPEIENMAKAKLARII